MTKIFFERSGGFMGRKVGITIDTDDLPDEQVERLREMLEEAHFFDLPEDMTRAPMPDAFTYKITVSDEEREHSVCVAEEAAPEGLRPLLDELSQQARMHR